jgi:hypothetical protein
VDVFSHDTICLTGVCTYRKGTPSLTTAHEVVAYKKVATFAD